MLSRKLILNPALSGDAFSNLIISILSYQKSQQFELLRIMTAENLTAHKMKGHSGTLDNMEIGQLVYFFIRVVQMLSNFIILLSLNPRTSPCLLT